MLNPLWSRQFIVDTADDSDSGLKGFGQLCGEEVANHVIPVLWKQDLFQRNLSVHECSNADAADVRPASS